MKTRPKTDSKTEIEDDNSGAWCVRSVRPTLPCGGRLSSVAPGRQGATVVCLRHQAIRRIFTNHYAYSVEGYQHDAQRWQALAAVPLAMTRRLSRGSEMYAEQNGTGVIKRCFFEAPGASQVICMRGPYSRRRGGLPSIIILRRQLPLLLNRR